MKYTKTMYTLIPGERSNTFNVANCDRIFVRILYGVCACIWASHSYFYCPSPNGHGKMKLLKPAERHLLLNIKLYFGPSDRITTQSHNKSNNV